MEYYTNNSLLFYLLLGLCSIVGGEVFTSISELETLLHTEGELARTIENYVQVEEQRIERVRRLGKEYKKLYDSAIGNAEAFLSHPVHAYLLVKHLTANWEEAVQLIDEAHYKISDMFENLNHQDLKFPGTEDLTGASLALIRLQETYLLNTTKIASGEISGTTNRAWQLSAGDCFVLGYQAYMDGDNQYCVLWMQEALKKLETESIPTANRLGILEYIAFSNYNLGKANEAMYVTQQIIEENPTHLAAYRNMETFDQYIRDVEAGLVPDIEKEVKYKSFRFKKNFHFDNYEEYEKLCRGERLQKLEEQSQLYCRYRAQNNSFLLLQPVKEEDLSLNPRIVMYHDVISDHDMDVLKQLAIPRLQRATVYNAAAGDLKVSRDRVSKSMWLKDTDHPVVARADRMIQAVTGLAVSSAEQLHVINYGIGGHYEPHYDFSREEDADSFAHLGVRNRIATWIYYLSDVEAGGYTVFPNIGVQVKPRKGSAAFWLNLKRSGEGDFNTIHAACPVMIGSKWVANKWFHEADNEFKRRCSLNREE